MTQVNVKYNPYKLETQIKINGKAIQNDSALYKLVKGKRLQEWVGNFPKMLVDDQNTVELKVEFNGMALDWDDFEDAFKTAKSDGVIRKLEMNFVEGKSDEAVTDNIVKIFYDLRNSGIEDFKDPKLVKAFDNINNSVFPINVIATMSSGKSTLINALLGKKLMPSKNEACTATITEILDNDEDTFCAIVHDEDENPIKEIQELTYDIMCELNADEQVHRISAEGNIPFLDARSTALMLVDTPGPNNSQNQAHKNTTYRAINSDANNLIIYVLNGTQLSTNDDASLLSYVAEQMKKGGKQVRDRFLFVVNKMDGFNPDEEDIEKAIESAKRYLANYGIEIPQIFPCSAYTALNIRTYLKDVDIDNLTRADERKLPSAARDTLPMIDKFIEKENMHLEKYSTLSPSAQQQLEYQLSQAEKNGDTKEQALIHCGIYSIEAAITAYVKKYAKTKKVKDLVESFKEVLESNQVLAKAKTLVATDEEAAKACAERATAVREKIDNGQDAAIFKDKIAKLDPMPTLNKKAEELKGNVARRTSRIFEPYGDTITNREEAKRLVSQFTNMSSDCIAEITSDLESAINHEVMETGSKILNEYQEKLTKIDESSNEKQLDFNTVDLIKGTLNGMKENVNVMCSDDFATQTVDDFGETTTEEKKYYEKTGQKEEKIADGIEKVKIGTKKVKSGSHREKAGTKTVRNPSKRWWKIFTPNYIEKDVYVTVDDYKDEDVYEDVIKYKTIMRDVFEERTETIEKFSCVTAVISAGLISQLHRALDDGIEKALEYAQDQITSMKDQFTAMFDELDRIIKEKYDELDKCANDQQAKEAELKKNKETLERIEKFNSEIDSILDI